MEPLLCPWEPAHYIFFSSNVPPLVHYSHLVSMLAAIIAALYVFVSAPRTAVARLFVAMVATFSIWILLDIILWATNRPNVVMFAWSLQIILEPLTYAIAFYLYYIFLYKRCPPFLINASLALLYLPFVTLLHTVFNLGELYLSSCEAAEGPLAAYYTHIVHATLIVCIGFMASHAIPRIADRRDRMIALLFGFGLLSFLLAFSSGTIIGSFTDDWTLSQYGLFGMPVFAAFIAASIIKFKAFNARVITAELLVVGLGIGVVSMVALQTIRNVRFVALATFALVCVVGYILVRNVRKEIEQRELIEKQERELEIVNRQQESLLHFISHEVKGYLTGGQNAFAEIVEGDYGPTTPQIKTLAQGALLKMRQGVETVMSILEASNLKKGTVMYKHMAFDLKKAVEDSAEQMRPIAAERGLTLELTIDTTKEYNVVGDKDKFMQHVIRNLIDNAIRYTPKGNIHVTLTRDTSIRFSVKDTGVGISAEDMAHLFTEGGHGKDSIKINVDSTGYGLYIAKQVTQVHGGRIWAESAGAGKGSEFIVELPAK